MIMHRVYVLTVKSREQNDQWTVGEVCFLARSEIRDWCW